MVSTGCNQMVSTGCKKRLVVHFAGRLGGRGGELMVWQALLRTRQGPRNQIVHDDGCSHLVRLLLCSLRDLPAAAHAAAKFARNQARSSGSCEHGHAARHTRSRATGSRHPRRCCANHSSGARDLRGRCSSGGGCHDAHAALM